MKISTIIQIKLIQEIQSFKLMYVPLMDSQIILKDKDFYYTVIDDGYFELAKVLMSSSIFDTYEYYNYLYIFDNIKSQKLQIFMIKYGLLDKIPDIILFKDAVMWDNTYVVSYFLDQTSFDPTQDEDSEASTFIMGIIESSLNSIKLILEDGRIDPTNNSNEALYTVRLQILQYKDDVDKLNQLKIAKQMLKMLEDDPRVIATKGIPPNPKWA